jgi:hypothetical protein
MPGQRKSISTMDVLGVLCVRQQRMELDMKNQAREAFETREEVSWKIKR